MWKGGRKRVSANEWGGRRKTERRKVGKEKGRVSENERGGRRKKERRN